MKSKKGLIITAAVVGLLLLLLIVVPYLIDVDNYRPTIEAALRSSIGRQVQIGHLRFSLATRALTAEEISISDDEAFNRSPFLQARFLEVGVEALPLLFSRELHINSLTLKEPQLILLRSPSGKWNFSSLGAKEKAGKAPQVPPKSAGSTLSGFSVQHLKITNGRVTVGRSPSGGTQQSYEDVNLEADHLSSSAAFPLKFSAKTPGGGKLKLEGTAGPIDPNGTIEHAIVHLNFNGQKLPIQDVQGLLQVLGVALPAGSSLHGGTVTANLAVDGPLNRLVTSGPVSVSNVTFSGFSLASKLGALASPGGLQGASDTLIQSMNSKLRVAPDGTRAEELNIVIPALGALTGAGTISPTNSLNFRMLAKLNAGVGGALGGLGKIAGLGQGGNELPFRIQGTTSNPVFLPDVSSALGGNLATPSQGALDQILGGLTGKKKP